MFRGMVLLHGFRSFEVTVAFRTLNHRSYCFGYSGSVRVLTVLKMPPVVGELESLVQAPWLDSIHHVDPRLLQSEARIQIGCGI